MSLCKLIWSFWHGLTSHDFLPVQHTLCALCVYSGSHVPGNTSIITAPSLTMVIACSDWLHYMASFDQAHSTGSETFLHQKMYKNFD